LRDVFGNLTRDPRRTFSRKPREKVDRFNVGKIRIVAGFERDAMLGKFG
jgi:hypothetical protein